MLKHSFYKNKDVVTKFGVIHFDSQSNSKDLTATQEAEFQGILNYEVVHATTTTTTTLVVGKKTKEVEKQMEETATSTTKKPRKRNTAPKKQSK